MFGMRRPDLVLFNKSARNPIRRPDVMLRVKEYNSSHYKGEGNPMYGRTPNYPKRRFVEELDNL